MKVIIELKTIPGVHGAIGLWTAARQAKVVLLGRLLLD